MGDPNSEVFSVLALWPIDDNLSPIDSFTA